MEKKKIRTKKIFHKLFTDGSTRVKIFFILLSVFLWLLIKLSKDGYNATIDFKVQYINIPTKYTFKEIPPEKVKVLLRAQGFNILKYKLQGRKTLKVDVSRLESGSTSDMETYWLTNDNLNFFENQFEAGIEVLALSPDTVHFHFSKLVEKKVPVELDIDRQFTKLMNIYKHPKLKPDSVIIQGPEDVLNEIEKIRTKTLVVTAEEETLSVQVPLLLPDHPKLRFNTKSTLVGIRFTQMTQGSFEIPVEIISVPDEYEIKIFPETVKLTYHVAIEDFRKVTTADFRVYGNAENISDNPDTRYINLQIESYPAFVNYVNYEPKRVEFILTKK